MNPYNRKERSNFAASEEMKKIKLTMKILLST